MTDWMPLKVLSKAALPAHVVIPRSSWSLLFGLRLRSTPCSSRQSASPLAPSPPLRFLRKASHRVWTSPPPVRVRFGRETTELQSVLTVTPVALIAMAWSIEVGVLPTLGSAAWPRMKRAEHVGVGRFLAAPGGARTPARSTGTAASEQ